MARCYADRPRSCARDPRLHASPSLAGVAIVSDIVASHTPKAAAERLQSIIRSFPQFSKGGAVAPERQLDRDVLVKDMQEYLKVLKAETPVINVSPFPHLERG